tara:strand:- start:6994 stop:7257 length:264 start_codon:yes stop_codon:yes gene_type:complete
MGFLKTVLIILLIYYLIKFLMRMFGPRLFGYAAKKTEQHFRERFGEYADLNNRQGETQDEVISGKKKSPKNNNRQKVGEYIDFEEID